MAKFTITIAASAAALVMFGAGASAAADNYGSMSLVTLRACTNNNTGACVVGPRLQTALGGGSHAPSSVSLTANPGAQAGSHGAASVEFGGLDLPILHANAYSLGNGRLADTVMGYQGFTFEGASGTAFGIAGGLDVLASAASSANGSLPGDAIYQISLAIYDAAFFPSYTDANSIFSTFVPGATCGSQAGLLAAGNSSGPTPGGAFSASVATASCAGGQFTLTHGQSVVVVASLGLFTNRGGFIDASHTFTTALDATLGEPTIQALNAGLVSDLSSAAPEPGAWALMLAGFAGLGAVLRRRRVAIAG